MQFNHVVCGGTFDHLHLGHTLLLSECLKQGKKVTVGITNGAFIRHKAYFYSLQSYAVRAKNVSLFNSSLFLYQLHDIYGPTLSDTTIDAICVTKDTFSGAEKINKRRKELGMRPLSIIFVPFVLDQNNEKISSEHIRQGIVNRQGKRYDTFLFSKEKYILPETLRGELRKPLGRIISSFSTLSRREIENINKRGRDRGHYYQCTVGDMVTGELQKRGIVPCISILDGLTQRKALNNEIMETLLDKERYNAENEKGTIQKSACLGVQKLFEIGHLKATKQLLIRGEEDLLTLVVVLFAPLGATIWYGQQGVGAVCIHVTEKKKEKVYNLLKKFN